MTWFLDHVSEVLKLAWTHAWLAGIPLLVGLLLALPLGWLARRYSWLYAPFTAGFGLLYTIPSLALFVMLPLFTGYGILDPKNVIIALSLYTLALLVRTVADGLGAVPDHVQNAATAMGYTRGKRFFAIELPLAVPVIAAGLRVAAVSNVSIVSVGTIIGVQQLGLLFSDGFNRDFYDPLIVGIIGCVVLALLFDVIIIGLTRLFTPWLRATGGRA
ncbi:osmoprotectant transport system permease protein [Pedococcus dokdonensis]|uniref:Osmoprotectant transport system permease protein n=1 Tax=Pedococcus dokdonensis TaxID=443156 RepID=A0A1H0U0C2_9MICO|nr:ABC transporter permease subunit [Pedococcus dokdonensis]SDP59624.1 osmoprotectant transport system permease protein [Pedococcus dokdonensis]